MTSAQTCKALQRKISDRATVDKADDQASAALHRYHVDGAACCVPVPSINHPLPHIMHAMWVPRTVGQTAAGWRQRFGVHEETQV